MDSNLLVWCAHSCRRDVFLQELESGKLPNYQTVIDRGSLFSSAMVGGHYQITSNLSEITGRPITSEVSSKQNLLNAARAAGAEVGVVYDWVIHRGAQRQVEEGLLESIDEVYPAFIDAPKVKNIAYPDIEFLPSLEPDRWLYWYRERSTHRHFYNFALAFPHHGGLFIDIVNETPEFARDQQRYSLRLQDKWFGRTLEHLDSAGVLDDTVIAVLSTHGTALAGWLPLMGQVTRATVDHSPFNFHPHVSRSFAFLAGPGVPRKRVDDWVSIMDLKPTLCRLLGLEDSGGSAYGVDLLRDAPLQSRILADVTSRNEYALWDTESSWLFLAIPPDHERGTFMTDGLPPAPEGRIAFLLRNDPECARPRTAEFLGAPQRERFVAEARRLGLATEPFA